MHLLIFYRWSKICFEQLIMLCLEDIEVERSPGWSILRSTTCLVGKQNSRLEIIVLEGLKIFGKEPELVVGCFASVVFLQSDLEARQPNQKCPERVRTTLQKNSQTSKHKSFRCLKGKPDPCGVQIDPYGIETVQLRSLASKYMGRGH